MKRRKWLTDVHTCGIFDSSLLGISRIWTIYILRKVRLFRGISSGLCCSQQLPVGEIQMIEIGALWCHFWSWKVCHCVTEEEMSGGMVWVDFGLLCKLEYFPSQKGHFSYQMLDVTLQQTQCKKTCSLPWKSSECCSWGANMCLARQLV